MSEEKVIMEAKLQGGSNGKQKVIPQVNQGIVSQNIAKSLTTDFMTMITIAGLRAVFSTNPNAEEYLKNLRKIWKDRTSAHLAEETNDFQNAINDALSSEKNVSQQTTDNLKKQMKMFCETRDIAVKMADAAVDGIITSIIAKNPPSKETQNENK